MTTNILLLITIIIAWLCILMPSAIYLFTSWQRRKDKILDLFNDDCIKSYFEQFYPNESSKINASTQGYFANHFSKLYGRRHYIIPLLILAVLSGIGLTATFFSIESWLDKTHNDTYPFTFDPIVISAFLGAYAWIIGDQLARYQTNDFTYHDVYNSIYRILVAIPLGLSLSAFAKDSVAVPFVFLLAAFPLQTLLKFSRRLVSQKLGLGETQAENGQLELQQLQGMSLANSERYLDEGVSTIAELAWTDPIDLIIRTNKDFSFVIDTISQALVFIYFEKK